MCEVIHIIVVLLLVLGSLLMRLLPLLSDRVNARLVRLHRAKYSPKR